MATDLDLVYGPQEQPRSRRDWALYSAQWVVTMVYAVVWGFALVGVGLDFSGGEFVAYMSAIVLTIGVSTFAQAWRGHRFAMVSGPNVIPSLAILAAAATGGREYALDAFAAQAIAGIVIAAIAAAGLMSYIDRVWSPLILGSMILMVGLAVAGTGVELMSRGAVGGWLLVAVAIALAGTVLAIRGPGVWATLPPLAVIGLGYAVFALFGEVDWDPVREAAGFARPDVFPYGFEMPPLDLVVIMLVVNLMAALNLYGNLQGYAELVGEEVDERKSRRTFVLFGLVETTLPGILGVPATVAYGENLGIVQLTRVAARAFIMVAAVVFAALAFVGPAVGVMAAIPEPVAGAVLLGIASTVVGIGADVMSSAPQFARREQTLVGFSVFLALGLYLLPDDAWDGVPRIVSTVLTNPVISVILFVMLFEQVLFRARREGPEGRDDEERPRQQERERAASHDRENQEASR
jgi:xanthine/uracil permease